MSWSKEQNKIFDMWRGRVPLHVLALLVAKGQAAVAAMASRRGVSVSFRGAGSHCALNVLCDVEKAIKSGRYTNKEITEMYGLKRHYVATVKSRMKKKETKNAPSCDTENKDLLNAIFA